jgi:hypothetical protein
MQGDKQQQQQTKECEIRKSNVTCLYIIVSNYNAAIGIYTVRCEIFKIISHLDMRFTAHGINHKPFMKLDLHYGKCVYVCLYLHPVQNF